MIYLLSIIALSRRCNQRVRRPSVLTKRRGRCKLAGVREGTNITAYGQRGGGEISRRHEILINLLFIGLWYLVVLGLFHQTEGVPAPWRSPGYILIIVSALVSLFLPLGEGRSFAAVLLIFKTILLVLIIYPLGDNLYLRILLQIPLLVEVVLYLPLPWGPGSAVFILLTVLFPRSPVSAWGEILPGIPVWERSFALLVQGVIVIFLSRYRYQSVESYRKREQGELLNRALQKVIDTNMNYQTYASSVREKTLEEERKRVSRELHDIIGYTLTNQLMIVQAARAFKQEDRSQLNKLLEKAETNLRESLEDARGALRQLRAQPLTETHGLKLFIKLVNTFSEITGIKVDLELATLADDLTYQEEKTLYRVIQEGMTNAFRHGQADTIRIILCAVPGFYECVIRDNGRGAAKVEEGIGLKGMREMGESLGGTLTARSSKDGFTLRCRLPREGQDD